MLDIINSYAVQLLIVSAAGIALGAALAWQNKFASWAVTGAALIISGFIFHSFIFNYGEVYQYSYYYKRAFSFLGDDIATVLALLAGISLYIKPKIIFYLCLTALLMTGGKTAIGIFVCLLVICWFYDHARRKNLLITASQGLAIALLLYFASGFAANAILLTTAKKHAAIVTSWPAEQITWYEQYDELTRAFIIIKAVEQSRIGYLNKPDIPAAKYQAFRLQGIGNCEPIATCIVRQASNGLRERYFSAIGGLWMTLEGGFGGSAYPNTPEKFAALMMQANPWGINTTYNLTPEFWASVGYVQHPYLHFGSGYGWQLLLVLLAAWLVIIVLALRHLRQHEFDFLSVAMTFFCIVTLINHTQNYIVPEKLLFTHMVCAGVILYRSLSQRLMILLQPIGKNH